MSLGCGVLKSTESVIKGVDGVTDLWRGLLLKSTSCKLLQNLIFSGMSVMSGR